VQILKSSLSNSKSKSAKNPGPAGLFITSLWHQPLANDPAGNVRIMELGSSLDRLLVYGTTESGYILFEPPFPVFSGINEAQSLSTLSI